MLDVVDGQRRTGPGPKQSLVRFSRGQVGEESLGEQPHQLQVLGSVLGSDVPVERQPLSRVSRVGRAGFRRRLAGFDDTSLRVVSVAVLCHRHTLRPWLTRGHRAADNCAGNGSNDARAVARLPC